MTKIDWQVTATTVWCDAVEDEVTIMVYKDGSAKCASYTRYGHPDRHIIAELNKKAQKLARALACEGPLCKRMTAYRDKIMAEAGSP